MSYEADRADDIWGEPSLTEMAEKALTILQKSDEGYFMLLEGWSARCVSPLKCTHCLPMNMVNDFYYHQWHIFYRRTH